jgi:leucyl aminopeptidase
MADAIKIDIQPFALPKDGDAVVFVGDDGELTASVAEALGRDMVGLVARTAKIDRFNGKPNTALAISAPNGLKFDRLIVVGVGGEKDRAKHDWRMLGGFIAGRVGGRAATVLVDVPGLDATPERGSPPASGSRAISSTSRPTSLIRRSSPAARRP